MKTRILIIEDEPQMRRNMATVLHMEGLEALTTEKWPRRSGHCPARTPGHDPLRRS